MPYKDIDKRREAGRRVRQREKENGVYDKKLRQSRERTGRQRWGKCQCGKEIIGHKRGYCSNICREKNWKPHIKTCPVCKKEYRTNFKAQVCCSKGCKNRLNSYDRIYQCQFCGKPYKPKNADRISYCSRECFFEAIKAYKPITAEIQSLHRIAKNNKAPVILECVYCGKAFEKIKRKKYCSEDCRSIHRGVLVPRKRPCKRCGIILVRQMAKMINGSKTYCKECGRLRAKASGKIGYIKRKYQCKVTQYQTIISIDQFIRDGWKCQLCGCDVDELGSTNKDNYANLDHIIPLAKCGQHILSNVQTLCRKCNMLKSDLMPNEVDDLLVHNRIVEIEGWNYKHIKTG